MILVYFSDDSSQKLISHNGAGPV